MRAEYRTEKNDVGVDARVNRKVALAIAGCNAVGWTPAMEDAVVGVSTCSDVPMSKIEFARRKQVEIAEMLGENPLGGD